MQRPYTPVEVTTTDALILPGIGLSGMACTKAGGVVRQPGVVATKRTGQILVYGLCRELL
ncbi:MAG: hypothetical protein P4L46_01720 [Fimbriimonas sp.]|nr:hypothetical protein [Fimbriimonas sp.]